MRSIFMIVAEVFIHQPSQMSLIHHDRMVDQITAAAANPALGNAVLPRTSEAGPLGLDGVLDSLNLGESIRRLLARFEPDV